MDPIISLSQGMSVLVIFTVCLLWFLHHNDFRFEPLIAVISAITAVTAVLSPPTIEAFLSLPEHQVSRAVDLGVSLLFFLIGVIVMAWIIYREPAYARRIHFWIVAALLGVGSTFLFLYDLGNNIRGVTIRAMLTTTEDSLSIDRWRTQQWEKAMAEEFERKTGARVEIYPVANRVEERLKDVRRSLKTNAPHVDVYAIDVIWPQFVASDAEDLRSVIKNLDEFNHKAVANNTVGKTKLVAVPWYIDYGLLFYRKKLLEKYGNPTMLTNWDKFEEIARKIQEGERKATRNMDFWGFVWQGAAYEGLTCNALEWQISHGGDLFVDKHTNDKGEYPSVAAFRRAKSWIGMISPPDILEFDESRTFDTWRKGNAAFLRSWPYAYIASEINISKLDDEIGVALLPKGPGEESHHASTLGGWQLMVNANSSTRAKRAAIKFVQFLVSKDAQKRLALDTGKLPTLVELYRDPDVRRKLPFIEDSNLENLFMGQSASKEVIIRTELIDRGRYAPDLYERLSPIYWSRIHSILSGKIDVERGVREIRHAITSELEQNLAEY